MQENVAVASWMVGRVGTNAHLYDGPDDASIPSRIGSRFDADKVDALKRLFDVAELFPQVVKNLAPQPRHLPALLRREAVDVFLSVNSSYIVGAASVAF